MIHDPVARDLYDEICKIRLIDPHSHINPYSPASKTLDDILGYHYYTELAHSAGMSQAPLGAEVDPQERCRALFQYLGRLDNTVQYSWFLEIARTFLGFEGEQLTANDADPLWDKAKELMAQNDWEQTVLDKSNLEMVFLTNDFDDALTGFDTNKYVPCLRTDDLVFHLNKPKTQERLQAATDIEVTSIATLKQAIEKLFVHFTSHGARACAISLPPWFAPEPVLEETFDKALTAALKGYADEHHSRQLANGIFWNLAEQCREHGLPFDLMIGVNRGVYPTGVFQGQDLFDQRTSLIQFAELFNAFLDVKFCISVLTSGQNQELASYSWIFPNVITSGHWWYSNVPVYIERDTRARLQAVPKTKQIGYYSDMYKLEFGLPKFNMYRSVLANVLANDFVRTNVYTEEQAIDFARLLLRENVQTIFNLPTES